jgi:hypothetical protein
MKHYNMSDGEGLKIINNNGESITLSYIDEGYNIYRYIIKNDAFVINFLNGNTSKMYDMLNKNDDYTVSINVGSVDIEYFKPVCLRYRLLMVNETSNNEKINLMLRNMASLDDRITDLSIRTDDLEEQLENGVVLPGYNGGIIDVNEQVLMLNYYTDSMFNNDANHQELCIHTIHKRGGTGGIESCKNFKFNNYNGKSLKPLKFLKHLKLLAYRDSHVTHGFRGFKSLGSEMKYEEFRYIGCLEQLEAIILVSFTHMTDLDFMSKCLNLKYVSLANLTALSNIDGLKELPNLVHIHLMNCPKITKFDGFANSVTIEK